MGRNRDNAPIGNTCPKIDEVISAINSVDWAENNYWDEKTVVALMEEIRKANEMLRGWGNDMCKERDEFEEERDNLKDKIKDLEDEIENLKSDKEDLEKQIEELNETIDNY